MYNMYHPWEGVIIICMDVLTVVIEGALRLLDVIRLTVFTPQHKHLHFPKSLWTIFEEIFTRYRILQ
jgi:hypothetical protein